MLQGIAKFCEEDLFCWSLVIGSESQFIHDFKKVGIVAKEIKVGVGGNQIGIVPQWTWIFQCSFEPVNCFIFVS